MTTHHMGGVVDAAHMEMVRQLSLWGVQNHPDGTSEAHKAAAEAAREDCDLAQRDGSVTWADILREEFLEAISETDPKRLREELIQVAAVALSWAESIDRREAL